MHSPHNIDASTSQYISIQLHGHLGREAAYQEGELGGQEGAVYDMGAAAKRVSHQINLKQEQRQKMEVVSGEGEDDDEDPADALHGAKQHLGCVCSQDLYTVSSVSSSAIALQDCPASSYHIGHHLGKVEDILRNLHEVGQHEDCTESLSRSACFWTLFGSPSQIGSHSSALSIQLHGHLGREAAYQEGELGGQEGAVYDKGAVASLEVGQHGDCSVVSDGDSPLLESLWVFFQDWQLIFRASFQLHGHLGRQAADQEGELGQQREAVPVHGAVGSMLGVVQGVVGVWDTVGWGKGATG